jgi:hypothetical protein
MKGQLCVVVTSGSCQGGQDPGVDGAAAMRRDRLLHRHPGDLMPELQPPAIPGQQPGRKNLIDDRWSARRHRLHQPQITAGPDERRGVQHIPGPAAQPGGACQHHVPGRCRDLAHLRLQHLGEVERVPARQPVQLGCIKPAGTGQPPYRAGGQRRELDPPGRPLPAELTQCGAQRVIPRQVIVSVGGKQQHLGIRQPPAKEPQQVDARLIGPVDVLHDHHIQRSRLADLAQQRPEQLLAASSGAAQLRQLPAQLCGQVKQRPERPGGEQAVARTPGPAGIGQVALELLHQRRLADARLAGNQHQPPVAPPRLLRISGQRRQRLVPLKQPHHHSVAVAAQVANHGGCPAKQERGARPRRHRRSSLPAPAILLASPSPAGHLPADGGPVAMEPNPGHE